MDTEVTALTPADYDAILDLWAEAGLPFDKETADAPERLAIEMAAENTVYLGLLVDGSLTGSVTVRYDGRRGWFERVAVRPAFRSRGLAGELIRAGEDWLARFGEVVICALIDEVNEPAMQAMEKEDYECLSFVAFWSTAEELDL